MNTLKNRVDLFSILTIPYNHPINAKKIFDWFKQDSIRRYKIIFDKECSDNFFDLKQVHEYYPNIRTIALVINPWDRVFQSFLYQKKIGKINSTFEKFVLEIENFDPVVLKNQYNYLTYTENGSIVSTDFIIRNEFFEKDFKRLQEHLNTSDRLTEQKTSIAYKGMYNERTKNKIFDLFATDIKYFGYNF